MLYQPFVNGSAPGLDDLQLDFLAMYRAYLDPRANQIMSMPGGPARESATQTLAATTGMIIDLNIVGWGWDPLTTMSFRQVTCGYVWVPSCLQGTPQNYTVMQSGPIPAGAIKVSLDSADYPAFQTPGPVFNPAIPWVGAYIVGALYNSTDAAKALQESGTPIYNGMPHTETVNSQIINFSALVAASNPNNLTWLRQSP